MHNLCQFSVHAAQGHSSILLRQGDKIPREGAILGDNVPDKPSTHNNCDLDWSVQQHMTGRRLIAIIERVYYQPRSGGGGQDCTLRAMSDICDCFVLNSGLIHTLSLLRLRCFGATALPMLATPVDLVGHFYNSVSDDMLTSCQISNTCCSR